MNTQEFIISNDLNRSSMSITEIELLQDYYSNTTRGRNLINTEGLRDIFSAFTNK